MTPKFIQANCIEGNRTDLRQARVVFERKPDIIFFEMPADTLAPLFNKYDPERKPHEKVEKIKEYLTRASKKYPYARSDLRVWENIESLWRNGHNVLIYNIDAPQELRLRHNKYHTDTLYSVAKKDLSFCVYLYVRERYMLKSINSALKNYREKRRPIVAVFLQSIHWDHVKFMMKNPSKEKIWQYYFGRFSNLKPSTIGECIKREDKILYKYWKKIAQF